MMNKYSEDYLWTQQDLDRHNSVIPQIGKVYRVKFKVTMGFTNNAKYTIESMGDGYIKFKGYNHLHSPDNVLFFNVE